ncbi:bifunctional 2-polyprenyl-6-hydroxyphenol methylase/3-demethylubiquinol 3-O-methyltransferase UbiG [Bosea sp. BIWAKO-01]|uniref:class I SAM-dependent methyltransferase n=1 Tax=Bosea sp. BIWAKO-01 TaxID=506668 RepID=UPI0008529ED9|nr:class I SAM-dependent methyltransferase [Bosea sp. BIWAKO-01]GAU83451.1 methyltransferase [Bosea sp. BIWAKO-01]
MTILSPVVSKDTTLLDLATVAPGLELRDPGIWFASNQGAVSYPAHGNAACLAVEDRSFWFRHRNRCVVSLVRRFSPEGVFLDIGGGNGFVAKGLTDAGVACGLVEPGIDGALAAYARGIDPVICARLEESGLPPMSIDAGGMFDVLEHIEDEVAALRQVHALLRPGGRLFLTVPAYQFLFSTADDMAGHFRRYTIASLSRVLLGSGFRIEFASYMFAPLPPPIFLQRTLPSLLGLRRSTEAQCDEAEHDPGGFAARVMDRLLAWEFRRLDAGRSVWFGTSCLCVAVKV